MAISLRAVVLFIVIIVAAASAITIFFPINTATGAAVDDLVKQLRVSTSRNLVQLTAGQFDPSRTLAFNLLKHFRLGGMNPYDGTHLESFIPTLCSFGTTTPYIPLIAMWNEDFAACQGDGTALYRDPVSTNYNYAKTTAPLHILNKSLYVLNLAKYRVTLRSWFPELKNRTGWSSLFIKAGTPASAAVIVGMPWYSPFDGSFIGVLGVSMWSLNLIKTLNAVTIGQTGRAMVYDATTGYFLAGNFNQSAVMPTRTGTRLTWVNDTTDALIVAAVRAVGGQAALQQLSQSYEGSLPYGEGDTAYIDVAPLTDSIGLNLRVMTVIRRSDFTGSIDQQRSVAIGIAVAVVVVLAMLSAGVVWWITAPLADVAESMNIEKSLSDEAPADATLSGLSEILAIQVAYGQLCAELKRVRSYLPASILRRLDADNAREDDDEELSQSRTLSVAQSRVGDGTRSASQARHDSESRHGRASSGRRSANSGRAPLVAGSVGSGMAAIEAALAPTTRRISVVALNLRGTHGHVARGGESALSELCGRYLDIVHEAAKGARGVVQLMHGDRVFVGFNASVRVASHATMAVEAAEVVRKRVRSELAMDVTAGVATGDAVVGLLGNAAMKQFSVVGRPFVHAAVLERLCLCESLLSNQCEGVDGKLGRVLHVLTDRATLSSAGFTIAMRAVDIVALPQASRPQMIGTLLSENELVASNDESQHPATVTLDSSASSKDTPVDGVKPAHRSKGRMDHTGADREWMYELSRAIAKNVFSSYTEAMDSFAGGNVATAMAKLREVTAVSMQPLVRATEARFTHLTASGHPNVASLARELGPYYSGGAARDLMTSQVA